MQQASRCALWYLSNYLCLSLQQLCFVKTNLIFELKQLRRFSQDWMRRKISDYWHAVHHIANCSTDFPKQATLALWRNTCASKWAREMQILYFAAVSCSCWHCNHQQQAQNETQLVHSQACYCRLIKDTDDLFLSLSTATQHHDLILFACEATDILWRYSRFASISSCCFLRSNKVDARDSACIDATYVTSKSSCCFHACNRCHLCRCNRQ